MNQINTAAALRTAADAVDKLHAQGVHVLGHYSNGRKPVLIIDKPPAKMSGVLRMRAPSRVVNGAQHTFASHFEGVQVEWVEQVPAVRAVGHG